MGQTVNDARFTQIVGRHLKFYVIAQAEADKAFPHLARNVGKNDVLIANFGSVATLELRRSLAVASAKLDPQPR